MLHGHKAFRSEKARVGVRSHMGSLISSAHISGNYSKNINKGSFLFKSQMPGMCQDGGPVSNPSTWQETAAGRP